MVKFKINASKLERFYSDFCTGTQVTILKQIRDDGWNFIPTFEKDLHRCLGSLILLCKRPPELEYSWQKVQKMWYLFIPEQEKRGPWGELPGVFTLARPSELPSEVGPDFIPLELDIYEFARRSKEIYRKLEKVNNLINRLKNP